VVLAVARYFDEANIEGKVDWVFARLGR